MKLSHSVLVLVAGSVGFLAIRSPADAQTIGSGNTVNVSALSSSATPTFQGGTLQVDSSGTYPNNFTLGVSTASQLANMIDAHGNAGTFSGVFSDATSGYAGNLTILDSVGGGAVVFTGTNTYTGPTTVNSGVTFALSGSGSVSYSSGIVNNGTFDISGATYNPNIVSLSGSGNVVLGGQSLSITAATRVATYLLGRSPELAPCASPAEPKFLTEPMPTPAAPLPLPEVSW